MTARRAAKRVSHGMPANPVTGCSSLAPDGAPATGAETS
jgi:hypothetical protein